MTAFKNVHPQANLMLFVVNWWESFHESTKVLSIKVLYMTYDSLKHIDLLKMNFCEPINQLCVSVCAPLSFLNSDNIN